uniref:Uncharacterized protein n=1 Tax=Xenopus tropicalis TaxID=8364 RepID=A0A803JW00_XENTR
SHRKSMGEFTKVVILRQNKSGDRFVRFSTLFTNLYLHICELGLILTLLSGEALNWASPLIEQQSPLLSDFNGEGSLFGWVFQKTQWNLF